MYLAHPLGMNVGCYAYVCTVTRADCGNACQPNPHACQPKVWLARERRKYPVVAVTGDPVVAVTGDPAVAVTVDLHNCVLNQRFLLLCLLVGWQRFKC